MYSYYAAYLIGARHQSCEGKILLVRPFICGGCSLSLARSHALSIAPARMHACTRIV